MEGYDVRRQVVGLVGAPPEARALAQVAHGGG